MKIILEVPEILGEKLQQLAIASQKPSIAHFRNSPPEKPSPTKTNTRSSNCLPVNPAQKSSSLSAPRLHCKPASSNYSIAINPTFSPNPKQSNSIDTCC